MSRYSQYLTRCARCGGNTSKKYAREHDGACKSCAEGVSGAKPRYSDGRKAFGGRCEDAPCCGCCGPQAEPEKYYPGYDDGGDY